MDFSEGAEISQQEQQKPLQGDPFGADFYNAPQNPQPNNSPYAHYPSNPNSSEPHPQQESSGVDRDREAASAVTCGQSQQQAMQPEVAAYFHDPSSQQQSWAPDSVGSATNFVPSNVMEQMVGANPHLMVANPDLMVWNNQMIHPFAGGMSMKRNLKKTKVVQSAWCELCKVDCNSQEMFNIHKSGKKHMKNVKKLEELKGVAIAEPVATTVTEEPTAVEILSEGSAQDEKVKSKLNLATKHEKDLETKKRKLVESGTAVDSLRVCLLCNVVCNSDTVFNWHLAGQKHAAKVAIAQDGMQPMVGFNPNPNPVVCTDQESQPTANDTTQKKKTEVQRVWCELCGVDCSSQEVLYVHKLGKKHRKNLEKLEESRNAATAAKPDNPEAGTSGGQLVEAAKTTGGKGKRKKAASTGDELEMKKQKLMECGTTADSVKVCMICNIVCNSETVYNSHLAGQKHATQMKKHATEITKPVVGPQPDSDATVTTTVGPEPVSVATLTSTVSPQQATAPASVPTNGPLLASVATATPNVGTHLVSAATSAPTVSPPLATAS